MSRAGHLQPGSLLCHGPQDSGNGQGLSSHLTGDIDSGDLQSLLCSTGNQEISVVGLAQGDNGYQRVTLLAFPTSHHKTSHASVHTPDKRPPGCFSLSHPAPSLPPHGSVYPPTGTAKGLVLLQ